MHKHYIELTLLPEGEVDLRFLWEKVYTKLHLALSTFAHDNNGRNTLGCSFPHYDLTQFTLGHKLRVFGYTEDELSGLRLDALLTDVLDYVHITSVKHVPGNCGLVCFGSVKRRTSASISKLARRRVKRSE
ncbi:type I-F CRISPR-associated endoribonuclease Cas6/Csy4, partial [Vibrio rotiferianus]